MYSYVQYSIVQHFKQLAILAKKPKSGPVFQKLASKWHEFTKNRKCFISSFTLIYVPYKPFQISNKNVTFPCMEILHSLSSPVIMQFHNNCLPHWPLEVLQDWRLETIRVCPAQMEMASPTRAKFRWIRVQSAGRWSQMVLWEPYQVSNQKLPSPFPFPNLFLSLVWKLPKKMKMNWKRQVHVKKACQHFFMNISKNKAA